MAKGDGGISKLDRNRYRVRVSFGKDPITGKYDVVSRNVKGTKADARKVRDQIRQEHENGLNYEGAKMTFEELATQYHSTRAASEEMSKGHSAKEQNDINTLCAYIGNVPIGEITAPMIERLYTTIRKDKIKEHGSYSGTSLNQVHGTLKRILKKAVDYDYILRNPCDKVQAPKKSEPQRHSLKVEEGVRLLQCINEAEAATYQAIDEKEARQTERGNLFGRSYLRGLNTVSSVIALRVGLATGMRRGEVFGLLWGCVDFEQSCIYVRKSLTTYNELKTPKTKAGTRTIHIDKITAEHLSMWKDRQRAELLKIGIKQNDNTPVCCNEKGSFIDLNNFERWWRNFRKENDFEGLRFHELRHTQATQLLANGVDVKTVQTRLGHSNAALTLNWYAHAIPENDEKAAQLVGELFDQETKTPILKVKTA